MNRELDSQQEAGVHGVITAAGSDWSYGGAILTFAFPMILFIAVGAALWVLYTMPHVVPGVRYRPERGAARPAPAAATGSGGQGSQTEGGQGSSPESGTDSQAGGATEGS
jgi:hypothetical protein